jgi:hypothetical protein
MLLLGCGMLIGSMKTIYYYEFLKSHSLIREYEIQGASRWWRYLYDHQPHSNLWKTIPSSNIFPGLKMYVLILFFMVYLSTLSVAQVTWHQIIRWLVIVNLEDVEGSDHGLIEVLSQHFPRGTKENQ